MTREEALQQWDSWVKYYKDGGRGSWPRDAFEALLDAQAENLSCIIERLEGMNLKTDDIQKPLRLLEAKQHNALIGVAIRIVKEEGEK